MCLVVRRRCSWRDRLFSTIRLVWMWWAQVSRRSRWRPKYRTFCVDGIGRLLRVIVGQFLGVKVKVQWADLDSFILTPQSLYQVWSRFKWDWMSLEAISGSELSAIITLSSAKSPVIVWLVVGWSEMYRLNKSGAATAPWGTPAWMGFISDNAEPERTIKYRFPEYEILTTRRWTWCMVLWFVRKPNWLFGVFDSITGIIRFRINFQKFLRKVGVGL